MVGDDLSFKGFQVSNPGSTILSVSTVGDDITYTLTEANIDLANINSGAATADMLSDIDYASGPNLNDILQWNGSNFVPVAASSLGTGEINTGSNLGSGQGVFASKVGVDLRFKGLAVNVPTGTAFSISATSDTITHTFNEGAISLANLDGGSPTIGDLTDVALSSLSNGDLLVYNSTSGDFENSTVATAVGLAYNLASSNIITPNNGGGNSNNSGLSSILAGDSNTISATTQESSVIGGGNDNTITNSDTAFIGGGSTNTITGESSAIVAGENNEISDDYCFIGGGQSNSTDSQGVVIGGGANNDVQGDYSFIGSGTSNSIANAQSVVVGGNNNQTSGQYSAILGGASNTASNSYATIAGGQTNEVTSTHGFIGAGIQNEVTSTYGVVGGGSNNSAITGAQATVGGGSSNIASGVNSTVAGGTQNTSSGQNGFIGGGILNNINAASQNSSIPGGSNNSTSTFDNVHILGSAITADAADTTYTQNLKASGSSVRLTGIPTASTSDILFYNSTTGAVSTASSTSVGTTVIAASEFNVSSGSSFPATQANPQTFAIKGSSATGWNTGSWYNPGTISIGNSSGSLGTLTETDLLGAIPVPFDIPIGATIKFTIRANVIRDSSPNTITALGAIMKVSADDIFELTDGDTEIEMLEYAAAPASKTSGNNVYWNVALTHTVATAIDENDSLFVGFAFDNLDNGANDDLQVSWSLAVIA